MEVAYSINGVPIRLTDERWDHIVSNKPYMESYYDRLLEAVERPAYILRGHPGTMVAIMTLGRHVYLHVVYREVNQNDGFIITAFISEKLNRRAIIWPTKS